MQRIQATKVTRLHRSHTPFLLKYTWSMLPTMVNVVQPRMILGRPSRLLQVLRVKENLSRGAARAAVFVDNLQVFQPNKTPFEL